MTARYLTVRWSHWRYILWVGLALVLLVPAAAWANADLLRLSSDPGQWPMTGRTYHGWNYSPLDQINRENVHRLQVVWTFQTGVLDTHEAQPLVVGDTMFVVTPKPNTVYALDLNRNGAIKWSFRPEQPDLQTAIARACCGAQTRGFAYAEGKVFLATLDGQLIALDAETGTVIWKQQNADLSIGETMTTAPLVVHDNVIVGVAGGEYGIRGHVTAYDINTGERKWRYYNTGPDEEMGIGPRFRPFYDDDKVPSPGVTTWYGDSWKRGGASIWGWFTFDEELNLFYYGTSNCAPWNPDYRRDPATAPGLDVYQNKYCASVLARDATTGELIWAYSITPQDQWDYDEPAVFMIIDLPINGEMRKALVHQARNGFFYVFDRATGELLVEPWPWTRVTWAFGIDMETGRPVYNPDKLMYTGQPVTDVCPISAGNWEQQTYSPQTGLFYMNGHNSCFASYTVIQGEYRPGETYTLIEVGGFNRGSPQGVLLAVNPVTGEEAWRVEFENFQNNFPLMATAGGLLFQGSAKGELVAYDAYTGEVLWSFSAGSGFRSSPISYLGPDGRQYIAVVASSPPTAQQVPYDLAEDAIARFSRPGSTIFVFALPND